MNSPPEEIQLYSLNYLHSKYLYWWQRFGKKFTLGDKTLKRCAFDMTDFKVLNVGNLEKLALSFLYYSYINKDWHMDIYYDDSNPRYLVNDFVKGFFNWFTSKSTLFYSENLVITAILIIIKCKHLNIEKFVEKILQFYLDKNPPKESYLKSEVTQPMTLTLPASILYETLNCLHLALELDRILEIRNELTEKNRVRQIRRDDLKYYLRHFLQIEYHHVEFITKFLSNTYKDVSLLEFVKNINQDAKCLPVSIRESVLKTYYTQHIYVINGIPQCANCWIVKHTYYEHHGRKQCVIHRWDGNGIMPTIEPIEQPQQHQRPQPSAPSLDSQKPKIINATNLQPQLVDESSKESEICDICMNYIKRIAFIPCGHLSCVGCSSSLSECHICREPITNFMKVFV
jgi:hypothetical protein